MTNPKTPAGMKRFHDEEEDRRAARLANVLVSGTPPGWYAEAARVGEALARKHDAEYVKASDPINPAHYVVPGQMECREAQAGMLAANPCSPYVDARRDTALKYIWRCGLKNGDAAEDLRKAIRNLEFALEALADEQ